jgi:molybdenum cofactor cytidylyltransferase
LIDRYQASGAPLAVPRYAGRRGNPVLCDRVLFPELLQVTGDQGGRPVLERHREDIAWLDVADPLPGADLDTVEEYRRLTGE